MAKEPARLSKLALKNVGDPKIVAAEGGPSEAKLGRLFGLVDGVITRKDATGEKIYEGLKGEFRAVPYARPDGTTPDPSGSTILYLPDFMHEPIARLYGSKVDPASGKRSYGEGETPPAGPIKFGVEVLSVKQKNPQGYSWKIQPLLEVAPMAQADLMGQLEAEISGTAKQIEGPAKKK